MMKRRISTLLALGLALVMVLRVAGAAFAQDDAEARATIAQALALLKEADSYAYAVTLDTATRLTDEAGNTFGTRQLYDTDGEASGADFHDTTLLTVTPLEAEEDTQSATLERIQVGDTLHVLLDDLLAEQFGVEAGWWAQEDLLATIGDDSVRRVGAEQLAQLATPATLVLEDDYMRTVEKGDGDEIDGVAMRVFDVDMKAVELALAQQGEQGLAESLESFLENRR